jgi:hypothetical protein
LLNEFLLHERLGIANRDQFDCRVGLEQFGVNLAQVPTANDSDAKPFHFPAPRQRQPSAPNRYGLGCWLYQLASAAVSALTSPIQKVEQLFDFREHLTLTGEHLHCGFDSDSSSIEESERFIESVNHFGREAVSSQGDDIGGFATSGTSFGQHERRDILHDNAAPTDKRIAADG